MRGGRGGKVCILLSRSPFHQAPRCARGYSGRGVPPWCVAGLLQQLHSSSVCLWFCCAKHSIASKWHPPNLAALPRAGRDPQKCLCASIRMCTVALRPLLLTVVTSRLFLNSDFCLKGIRENLASPLHAQALSTALSWVFGLKNICK